MDKITEKITEIFKKNESVMPIEGHGIKVIRRINYPKIIEGIKEIFTIKTKKKTDEE